MIDLAKRYPRYYRAKAAPERVAFGPLPYLTVQGAGSPDSAAFAQATEALYTVAYAVRARFKARGTPFKVARLEGLWWVEGERYGLDVPREEWQWKLMIQVPQEVDTALVGDERSRAAARKRDLSQIADVSLEPLDEGECVQILHVGPYATEPETLAILYAFMDGERLALNGLHHEIYLSDHRRAAPEKMQTILRYPVRPA